MVLAEQEDIIDIDKIIMGSGYPKAVYEGELLDHEGFLTESDHNGVLTDWITGGLSNQGAGQEPNQGLANRIHE